MKNFVKYALLLAAAVFCIGLILKPVKAYAAPEESAITEEAEANTTSAKAYAAAIAIGLAAAAGAIAMGLVIAKTADGIARQPEAEGKLRTAMMLGLVFVETVVIYALIVAILIVFVL